MRNKITTVAIAFVMAVVTMLSLATPAQAAHDYKLVASPGVVQNRYGKYHVPLMYVDAPDPKTKIIAWSCTPWIQSQRMVVKNVLHDPLFGKPRYRKQQVPVWDVVYGYGPAHNHLTDPDRKWSLTKPRLPGKRVRSVMTCAFRVMVIHNNGTANFERVVKTLIGPERIF